MEEKKFGEYLKEKRMNKPMSIRALAEKMNVSPTYLSDVERGLRRPLPKEKIEKAADALGLTDSELREMFDIAAREKGEVIPEDIVNYAGNIKSASIALRMAKELNLGEKEWVKIIEKMKETGKDE